MLTQVTGFPFSLIWSSLWGCWIQKQFSNRDELEKNLYSQISVCFALFLRSCFSCIITFINTHFWLAVSKLWSSWKLSLIHTQHIVLYFPKLDAFSYLSAALILRGRIVIRRERMWKMGDWCRLTSKPKDWHW